MRIYIILFFLFFQYSGFLSAQEMITFEHVGYTHSGLLSSAIFNGQISRTPLLNYRPEKVWTVDSLNAKSYNKLDSLLKLEVSNIGQLKDTVKYGSYKVTSFTADGKVKYSFYICNIDSSISFFRKLLDNTKSLPQANELFMLFDFYIHILEDHNIKDVQNGDNKSRKEKK